MNSYNKSYLDSIAKEKGFVRDNLEKVIRLAEVLRHLNQNPLLHQTLALKGGTAINLMVFQMPRLSVDIDLDFIENCSKEEMINKRQMINQHIQTYMAKMGYVLKAGSKSPHSLDSWIFGYTNAGGNPDNIKIEINYSNRQHVLPIVEGNINIDFLDTLKCRILSPLEIFGSKINALINRAAVRDIYDIYKMITSNLFTTTEENELLRKILVFYITVGSICKAEEVNLKQLSLHHIERLSFSQVRAQLLPVLNRNEKFELSIAKEKVIQFLKQFLQFSKEEQLFVEHFNQRIYSPEILFGKGEMAERVSSHPMALWKCRPKQ